MTRKKERPRSSCPISFALEIFGDRWTLIVLRDVMLKSRTHFKDLQACEEAIATNVLSDRLKRLERRGLIRRQRDEADGRQFIYLPTELAVDLVPMLVEMTIWGMKSRTRGKKQSWNVASKRIATNSLLNGSKKFATKQDQHEDDAAM